MAKVKLTKTELKNQRDALKRFTRYLPTLQLKKQQLQMEVQRVKDEIEQFCSEKKIYLNNLNKWIELFCSPEFKKIQDLLEVSKVNIDLKNIAGIDVPYFENISFKEEKYDFFTTLSWYEDAIKVVKKIIEMKKREEIMQERYSLLEQELRVTNQRVNLFEKVMIPDTKENIRKIQIYLGDQQTAGVGRSKIAKKKMEALTA